MKKKPPRKKIGQVLVELGLVTQQQVNDGLEYSGQWGKKIGVSLVALGHLKEEDLVTGLASFFSVEHISLEKCKIPKNILKTVSEAFVSQYQVLPVRFEGEKLVCATSDPSNFEIIQNLEFITGNPIRLVVTSETELKDAINHYYKGKPKLKPQKMKTSAGITSKEKLLSTIKGCLTENVISKDELISELIDL